MKIGKTNAIFGSGGGGGVVLNFVPLVAPESFNDPLKYADYGCTVNLYEKLRMYKMIGWRLADIAVEFSDAIASVNILHGADSITIVFETVSGIEKSTLYTYGAEIHHTFTDGSTKRYMIRRVSHVTTFELPFGSVWAYCIGINTLSVVNFVNPHLKYIFFHEYTLMEIG